ncbi:hypothetical protein AB01_0360 [Escherichia coli 2-177-06_S1_C1]|uniref:Uncharacterized protein n=1 Tax=Escherichia coli DEC2D TaxID=868141 RepID=A0A828UCW5_ECOLX|nr:hypothetical protein ECDEC1A_0266 [Escherichia coli DEC1A]EHU15734.1 hypothetical protein ECDEC1C_0270 [Escherichia coli DEC1C]EHU31484.1 hypothetical protein ECDEC1E_0436 [Escherichia coli DEC1E]EHU48309.1 hypothetical protein ECDEC2D_0400 [Escherichia coli DEC2D]EHU50245.1 hypothetical protein ECDEC2C_0288 [Escherichia coli DEC2C]EHU62638.1 hypothetical protein ECDEC2E_0337 [Escherichia coli DEC2E]EMV79535.1 hypothetical protein EC2866550_0278 [Escherichia coli 2866550]EMV79783.1 hypoth
MNHWLNHFTSFGVLDYEGINSTTFRLLKLNKDFELFITNNQ